LKQQDKYNQIPSGLLDWLKRILAFADIVAEEITCEETDLLEKVILRIFEVMHRVASVSCGYVKHGRWSLMAFASADNSSENGRRVGVPGDDRRNGQKVAEGCRRLRPYSKCWSSAPNPGDW
jgi:hypothetical protein